MEVIPRKNKSRQRNPIKNQRINYQLELYNSQTKINAMTDFSKEVALALKFISKNHQMSK